MELENRIAVVTGGGQGLGQQIALRLARAGASVVITDINTEGAHQTAEMIASSSGPSTTVIPTDIRQEAQVKKMIETTLAVGQRIDILVNNSGVMGPVKYIEDITVEEWEDTMSVNLRGMFLCCKYTIPAMKKQGRGCIINISSITGKRALTERTPYATSKMGVIGLTRTLATEAGKWNIRVNSICPGAITGPRLDRVLDGIMKFSGKSREQVISERVAATALNTFIDPKYVAAVVAFMCSDDAAMITGQDINVCGGTVMY